MNTRTTEEIVNDLTDYLTGYGRNRSENLKNLRGHDLVDSWTQLAQDELDRRATEVITALDNETLSAIAKGKISVDRAITDALKRLETSKLL